MIRLLACAVLLVGCTPRQIVLHCPQPERITFQPGVYPTPGVILAPGTSENLRVVPFDGKITIPAPGVIWSLPNGQKIPQMPGVE